MLLLTMTQKTDSITKALQDIHDFLPCVTPKQWIDNALANQDLMLIDHAHCEKKAASTALSLMYRYVDNSDLLNKMSRLAREELRHFRSEERRVGKECRSRWSPDH